MTRARGTIAPDSMKIPLMPLQNRLAIALLVGVTALSGPAHAAAVKNGVVPKKLLPTVQRYLGDYEGQWNSPASDVTAAAPGEVADAGSNDSISRYRLANPVLRLSLDPDNRLRMQFFIDPAAARTDDELDLLGFGCRSRVGDLLQITTAQPPKAITDEPYQVLGARFDFDWGNCPSRVYAVSSNDLQLALLIDPVQQQYVVQLRLLKRMQSDGKIMVEEGGVQRQVKVRPKASDPGSLYAPNMEYCVLNEFGEIEKCFDRETELKQFLVPFPFPGMSAVWYTKQSPKLKVVPGVKTTYHEAVFHRPIDANR